MAAVRLVRGFKADAERISLELREELGIGSQARLDPVALAKHLCVPVLSLEDVRHSAPEAVRYFLHGGGRFDFSAATVYSNKYRRFILTNPAHSDGRQMSSLSHELGHVILAHESEAPLGDEGRRDWNPEQEREADWLAGCLLIPAEATFAAARRGDDDETAANFFGVSVPMAAMRMNVTGARVMAARGRAARRKWT